MKITIGFSRAKSKKYIGSVIICLVENRSFSHAYIKYQSPETKEIMISQASHGAVNLFNNKVFEQNNQVVEEYEFFCTPEQFNLMRIFIDRNLGKPYSRIQLVWIGVKKLFGIKHTIVNGDGAFICSEWAKRICETIGFLPNTEDDLITPSDLNTIIKSLK